MNVQEYISSGIVESCVLGISSPEEQSEFEQMCSKHPEVLQARIEFELALEKKAFQHAISPPPGLKEQIFTAAVSGEAKILPIGAAAGSRSRNWLRYAVAASLLLLAASLYWNVSQYNSNKALNEKYEDNLARLNDIEKEIAMISLNPNVKMAALRGMEPSPASFATVYWDTTSRDVYLLVNNLPKPASDKQYQLWALLDGKPIDVGMIDNESFLGQKRLLLRMKNVSGAQAFAITLEKKGGNPTPLGEMYVMGNL